MLVRDFFHFGNNRERHFFGEINEKFEIMGTSVEIYSQSNQKFRREIVGTMLSLFLFTNTIDTVYLDIDGSRIDKGELKRVVSIFERCFIAFEFRAVKIL